MKKARGARKIATKAQRKKWNKTAYTKLTKQVRTPGAAKSPAEATPSEHAFARTKGGKLRPPSAVRMAESRNVAPIVKDLLRAGGPEQQEAALRKALDKPELKEVAKPDGA